MRAIHTRTVGVVRAMPALLTLMTLPVIVLAQAPIEDRGVRRDPYVEAQQRAEFARRAAEEADQHVAQAVVSAKAAEAALASARSQLDAAKAGLERARKDLAQARAKAGELHRTYEREATEFERVRRGGSAR